MNAVLIYDGRCGFCAIWVEYWRRLSGDRVVYVPSQETAWRCPEISAEEFKRSVWLIEPDGKRTSGAEAVFRLIAQGTGKSWPLWFFEHVPGFAVASETSYRFIAGHRSFFYWVTRLLWGKRVQPASHAWTRSLFLRGLALTYLIAFISLLPQITGLIGDRGILPQREYLDIVRSEYGGARYWLFPTLAWINASDAFLHVMAWSGIALAAMLLTGILPMIGVIGLFALYLSVDTIGQAFFSFQWDALLLEAGFAAILVTPFGWRPAFNKPTSRIGIWVLRFLIFRLMLESGLVKLLSRDPTWRGLTALTFHYETQPLPTPVAWYAHHLPAGFQKFSVIAVFAIELAVPFLFLMPRKLRITGAWITIAFQLQIALTGNYTFFNLLAIVLCIALFDDRHLQKGLRVFGSEPSGQPAPPRWRWVTMPAGLVVIGLGLLQLLSMGGILRSIPEPLSSISYVAETFHVLNRYGLFAVMTTSRPEIIIEGSSDGQNWNAYEFPFKPGDLHRPLPWVAPYQPRLDWQMWFAALSSYQDAPWFSHLIARLLEGSPDVLRLLSTNPFAGKPPRFIRAVIYDYHFSDSQTRRSSGAVWTRRYLGEYFPAVSLRQ